MGILRALVERKRKPDAFIVERARKNVQQHQRWGRWWTALHVALSLGFLGTISFLAEIAYRMAAGNAQRGGEFEQGFLLGLLLGVFGGGAIYYLIHHTAESLVSSFPDRRDELILSYYDQLRGHGHDPDQIASVSEESTAG